jgi:hypothetical protein
VIKLTTRRNVHFTGFLGTTANVAKCAYWLRNARLSVCRLLSASPSKRISVQFDIVDFYVNLSSECKIGLKSIKKKLGILQKVISMCHCCCRYKFATKALFCYTQYFCIFDRDMCLNNIQRMDCCFCVSTMLTR